jgi:hypothetical protein
MKSAVRGLLIVVPAILLGTPALSQVTLVSVPQVTGICASENATDEQCFSTVDSYLSAVTAPSQITDAVFSLASTEPTILPICLRIAEAIRILGTSTVDAEQQLQIAQIAETVAACNEIPVAAIAPLSGIFASPN